ncbi:MAG TPA: sulfite exporter TauE/SafE family protein [Candidatus Saccharimonadales bacterium]|nr:sulfite exporter TauE/SafE family protein [Candidatus Saccharimonadales bacterium]
MLHWLIYLGGGLLSGGVNSIAGGGSLFLFPLLIGLGLPPIRANTTMGLIVQPGTLASVIGARQTLQGVPKYYYLLLIPMFFGGLAGAVILLDSSPKSFEQIAPVLMLVAIILLLFQDKIHSLLYNPRKKHRHYPLVLGMLVLVLILVAVYGGYFGAGFGIITLGLFGLTKLKDIQQMNTLKNIAGVVTGVADSGYFIAHHVIDWHILPLFVVGNIVGGYYTALYSTRLPTKTLRKIIIVIAIVLTAYLFYKYH